MQKKNRGFWPFDEIYARPGHLIRRLQQIAVGIFMGETEGFDITPIQYAALLAIKKKPGIVNTQLADVVALDRSTIGELISRLERRGLVTRAKTSSDLRVKKISITTRGEKLLRDVESAVNRTQDKIMAPLPRMQRGQFKTMLARMVHLNNEYSRAPLRLDALTAGTRKSAPRRPRA
jgi:MarR family transcriptional regulator, lower aerobic nicotinate degradation pathway regulator